MLAAQDLRLDGTQHHGKFPRDPSADDSRYPLVLGQIARVSFEACPRDAGQLIHLSTPLPATLAVLHPRQQVLTRLVDRIGGGYLGFRNNDMCHPSDSVVSYSRPRNEGLEM